MNESVLLQTALCLPAPDIEALIQGRMIAAMPRKLINSGQQFALYPDNPSIKLLPLDQYYHSSFLSIAQSVFANLNLERVLIKAWARCELCQILNDSEALEVLSQLTVWTKDSLQQTLLQKPYIFLAHLRVYLLPQPLEVPVHTQIRHIVPLPQQLKVSEATPVFSDRTFSQRRHQLKHRIPPEHPELEELQRKIAILSTNNSTAAKLDLYIQTCLGWKTPQPNKLPPDYNWIYTIKELGTATTGGNYEKGTAFEQIVHKSLTFLGFSLDPNAKGGAGGMDLYCTTPYPLVGECKAGKSIPDNTVEQLSRIGKRHLGKYDYEQTVKLIIGPGEPSTYLKKSAQVSTISIIQPMTLQKLVELHAKHPGSVNLMELKQYLVAGQIDEKIDEYINKVEETIKLRSQIVTAVKQLGEGKPGSKHQTIVICTHYNAVFAKETNAKLDNILVHDLLVELSSPLTGYLGRDKESDCFYFLRDLS